MADKEIDDGAETYHVRETVGVFDTADASEAAVDRFGSSGFERAGISVLASDRTVRDR